MINKKTIVHGILVRFSLPVINVKSEQTITFDADFYKVLKKFSLI